MTVDEHPYPEASEPTAPSLGEPEPAAAAGNGEGGRPAGTARSAAARGAVTRAATSRGAGWGVAVGLAGLIAGYAIGHSTAPSASPVAVVRAFAGAPGPGQVRRAVVPPAMSWRA